MDEKKVVDKTKEKEEIAPEMQEALELAVQNAMKNFTPAGMEKMIEIQETTANALKEIAERSVPTNVQAMLAEQEKNFESPYVIVDDKLGILHLSTADGVTADGWPGHINEVIPGQYTKQGSPKRLNIPVVVEYNPGLDEGYSFEIVDRKEYEAAHKSDGVGGIPQATMIANMSARAGG